jgi:hypothetical protein
MNSKLFLGIILIITIISSMLITITEGVCNYDDGGGISGNQGSNAKGAPVTNRTKDACNQGTIYDNEERLKQAESKLNELKKIAAKVDQGVLKKNRKGILDNLRAAKELASAGGDDESDSDSDNENPACEKYPEACSDDENDGYPAPPTDSRYSSALKG